MPAPSLTDNLTAVLGLPVAFLVTSLGVGLLIERVLGARLPNALLVPLGACGSIVVSLIVYWTGSGDVPAVVLLIVLTVAGGVFARGGVISRLNLGWAGLAGLATYLLFIAPELFTGHWTWSGYNFVNDTATQFLLSSYLKTHGTIAVGLGPPPISTATEFLRAYLGTSYPLGTQAHLATLSGLLHADVAVLYQGYLSAMAAVAAMSIATLPGRLIGPRMAALGGFLAAGASLTYQYAMQGNIKEIGTLATSMAALAIIRQVIVERVDVRGGLLAAVPLAAVLDCYYSAGLPFAGAVAGVSLVSLVVLRWRDLRATGLRMLGALGAGVVATLALAAPASASITNSFNSLASAYIGGGAPTLGQLLRPLPLSQVSGVWLTGDYRYPVVSQPEALLTVVVTVFIFVLAAIGVILALRAREAGPAALLAAMGLVLAVVVPTVTPYAGAKALAIASPAFVFTAFVGAEAIRLLAKVPNPVSRGRRRPSRLRRLCAVAGAGAAAVVGLAVLASDGFAYHYDNVAPTSRIVAIQQVGDHFAGRGPVLWQEFEEYAKYFADRARLNVPFETLTPRQAQLIAGGTIYASYYDLDQEPLSYVESFPIIVLRRSPSVSRPPANYWLAFRNRYYEAWVRSSRPVVLRHLGIQLLYSPAEPAPCPAVQHLAAGAPRGSSLLAAVYPISSGYDPRSVDHSSGWIVDPGHPEALSLQTPGSLDGSVHAPRSDLYQLWVQGNLARPVTIEIDGRKVGQAQGVNTVNQWLDAGWVYLHAGTHRFTVIRPGGGLAPGDGGVSWLGPGAILERGPERLERLPVSSWRSLCNRTLDWVELVRG